MTVPTPSVLLVTVPDDRDTLHLIDSDVSDKLLGCIVNENFHAAWSKNKFIAKALEKIYPRPAILIDADTWMSQELAERLQAVLEAAPAEGFLYGLAGRRICEKLPVHDGSPRVRLDRHQTVIGYCQFTRENSPQSWKTPTSWGEAHDDWKVYNIFGEEKSVALPFACFHVGTVSRHWGGFQGQLELVADETKLIVPTGACFADELIGKHIVLLEAFGGADAVALANVVENGRIYVVDSWELDQFPLSRVEELPLRLTGIAGWRKGKWDECRRRMLKGEPALSLHECVIPLFLDLIAADRKYTRKRFERAIFHVNAKSRISGQLSSESPTQQPITLLGEGGKDPVSELVAGDVSAIWISGEIGYSLLLKALPHWLCKFPAINSPFFAGLMERNGLVCGGFHDIVNWKESTACIELLIGTPDVITPEGQWLKRLSFSAPPLPPHGTQRASTDAYYPLTLPLEKTESILPVNCHLGIVFYHNDRDQITVEGLMFSLHDLRKYWNKDIVVLFSGEESPSIRIVCARYEAIYRELPEPEIEGAPHVVTRVYHNAEEQVNLWSPFHHTLWIATGTTGVEAQVAAFCSEVLTYDSAHSVSLLHNHVALQNSESDSRTALELEVMRAWSATVRVRYGATIVIGLIIDDLAGFQRNWSGAQWRHASPTLLSEKQIKEPVPLILVCYDIAKQLIEDCIKHAPDAAYPAPSPSVTVVVLKQDAIDPAGGYIEPHWTSALSAGSHTSKTEWLIYLDPMMHPSPGAELFLPFRLPDEKADVYAPGWGFRRIGIVEWQWANRVFRGNGALPKEVAHGNIFRHLRLGPPATLIRRIVMQQAIREWSANFDDMPFEVFLTLQLLRDKKIFGVCRPQDWGWTT